MEVLASWRGSVCDPVEDAGSIEQGRLEKEILNVLRKQRAKDMYLTRVSLRNIRSITELTWDLGGKTLPGWHVVIGDNGSGKSTFLRAIALALLGPVDSQALGLDWGSYLRYGAQQGAVDCHITRDKAYDLFAPRVAPAQSDYYAAIGFDRALNDEVRMQEIRPQSARDARGLHETQWDRTKGWFSVAYGPFRRFTGGEEEDGLSSRPIVLRHLSIFSESVALTNGIKWLQSMQFMKLENRAEGKLLDSVKRFINQNGFLPHDVRLTEVSSKGVEFTDGAGVSVSIEDLSDGYRSILSMTLELLRQLTLSYSDADLFQGKTSIEIKVPGVVLIDEVDVHLHPSWQRQVGPWFRKHFPNMQFIVTSHSPLVCQAADAGTVWRLPLSGSEEEGGFVEGASLERLLYGDILDAYSTNLFGMGITRSEKSDEMLQTLAMLNMKALHRKLTVKDQQERDRLRRIFASMPGVLGGDEGDPL